MVEYEKGEHPNPLADTAWNFKSGSHTSWNIDPNDMLNPTIDLDPPTITELPGGIITPRDSTPRFDEAESRKRIAEGGVYDRDLNLLPIFLEREKFEAATEKGNLLINPPKLNEDALRDAQKLSGQYVYIGILRGHFGHFLLESLSRMWAVLKSSPDIKIIAHGHEDMNNLPSYIRHVFDLLELDVSRITTSTRTVVVENLLFPKSEFEIRWKGSASYADLFRELHERNSRLFPKFSTPNRVYLTRSRLKTKKDRALMKSVQNEEAVEQLFAARGFEIVAPETLPFPEQISIIGKARQIAGVKGSALHMSLFSQQPKARVIQLCRTPTINQTIINGIKNIESHDIGCQSPVRKDGSSIDVEIVRAALRAM